MCKCCCGGTKRDEGKMYECKKCGKVGKEQKDCCGEMMKEKK